MAKFSKVGNTTVNRQNDRKLLLSDGDMDSNFIEVDVRNSAKDKLLENTENLERSSRKLDHGQELLHESESVGAGVLADLAHQKEVISRARNRVRHYAPETFKMWS